MTPISPEATPKTHRAEKRFQAIIGKLFLVGRHEAGTPILNRRAVENGDPDRIVRPGRF